MTVDLETNDSETADYSFWDAQPSIEHGMSHVRHVRTTSPLEIVVDGQSRHGVVMRPGKAFDVYVAQVDAFMALAQDDGMGTPRGM